MKRIINNRKKMRPFMIFMIGFVFVVLILNTAFSLMSSTLLLSGEASFRPNKDVRITSVSVNEYTSSANEQYDPNYSIDSVITSVNLPNLDSSVTYKVRVENNGNVDVELSDIVTVNSNNDDITYSVSGIAIGSKIVSTNHRDFYVTFEYKDGVSTVPSNTVFSSRIKFDFIDVVQTSDDYARNGLVFDLEGTEAPVDNKWEDLSGNGNDVRMQNMVYSSYGKSYSFSGSGSCGFFDKSLIPTSGNFTMDVTFTIGDGNLSNADQAIVAQKVIGTKEPGRFKPFNVYENTVRAWGYLTSSNGVGDSSGEYAAITSGNTYTLTLVRNGNDFKQYVNGILVNTYSVQAGQTISTGTTQIGCFDGGSSQNFTGSIHAVRLYDRILTDNEIISNYEYNLSTYYGEHGQFELLSYVEDNLVTSGVGIKYRNERSKYYYQGSAVNNYIRIGEDLFRIISFESDGTMQIYQDINYGPIAFDASGNRTTGNNSYCTSASSFISGSSTIYYGCNAFSPFPNFTNGATTGAVNEDSTLKTYLNTTVYNALNSTVRSMIVNHDFNVGPVITSGSTRNDCYNEADDYIWNGKVGTFNVGDLRYSQDSDFQIDGTGVNNYILKNATTAQQFWTMNGVKDNTYDMIMMITNRLSKRRASRDSYSPATYYTKPVMFVSSDLIVSGTGMYADPFVIHD